MNGRWRYRRVLMKSFLRLIRAGNLLIIVLTQYLVRIFLVGPKEEWLRHLADFRFFLLSLSTVLIAAAGYIINDYYDIKIDTINKPRRVVIGRMLRRRHAMFTHSAFNALGIGLGLLVGLKVAAVNLLAAFVLWLYSNQLKRRPFIGNFTVALLTAASLLVIVVYVPRNRFLVFTFALFAFFISLIREIIKDMEDLRGDATFGCQTLPIVWGIRRTKSLLYILIGSFLVILFTLSFYLREWIVFYFSLFVFLPTAWLTWRLARADTRKEFGYLSTWCKIIMLSGVLSMVLL
ncbi:MAG: geranylgeranylglycerol-phosphate geranylgeranyltransferase [Cytophagales bacterium]|nr:geranylgeranylglycerol-phosphate geranylgeranyltransferase [Cytophagales bacterium]